MKPLGAVKRAHVALKPKGLPAVVALGCPLGSCVLVTLYTAVHISSFSLLIPKFCLVLRLPFLHPQITSLWSYTSCLSSKFPLATSLSSLAHLQSLLPQKRNHILPLVLSLDMFICTKIRTTFKPNHLPPKGNSDDTKIHAT